MRVIIGLLRTIFHLVVAFVLVPMPALLVLNGVFDGAIPPLAGVGAVLGSALLYWLWLTLRRWRRRGPRGAEPSSVPSAVPSAVPPAPVGAVPPTEPTIEPVPLPPMAAQAHHPHHGEFVIRAAQRLRSAGWRVEWFEDSGPLGLDLIAGIGRVTVAVWCRPDPFAITAGDVHRAVGAAQRIGVGAAALLTEAGYPDGVRRLTEGSGLILLTPPEIDTLWSRFDQSRSNGTHGGSFR